MFLTEASCLNLEVLSLISGATKLFEKVLLYGGIPLLVAEPSLRCHKRTRIMKIVGL
jgi:hypothetical protein